MILDELLSHYTPFNEHEAAMMAQLKAFLTQTEDNLKPFGRELAGCEPHWGHVTGSAWVVNLDASRVVLVHHAKLNRWVQPGGHCDGETDVLAVALREAQEETGLAVIPLQDGIFDIDVHLIPEYWNTPEHWHYDVRFLLHADDRVPPQVSSESHAVRWATLQEAEVLNSGESISRMIAKTLRLPFPS
jgi:8-oxo-dGTP pyrophosphatase MutT (NUDIX family)